MQTQLQFEHPVLVAKNVFRPQQLMAVIGDFFLCEKGLYYVPYWQFQCTGKIGGFLSGAIGGLAGGLATALGNKQNAAKAVSEAALARDSQYGLSLEQRMPKHEWALFVPRSEIASLQLDGARIICQSSKDTVYEFILSERISGYESTFHNYLSGFASLLQDFAGGRDDLIPARTAALEFGFDLASPAPAFFLGSLSKESQSAESWLAEALQNKRWLSSLHSILKQEKKLDRRKHCEMLRIGSPDTASALQQMALQEVRGYYSRTFRQYWILLVLYWTVVGIFPAWATVSEWRTTPGIWDILPMTVWIFLVCILFPGLGINWEIRKTKALLRSLG